MKIIKISALWCPACLITNKAIDKIKEEQNIEVENLDYDFDEDEVKKWVKYGVVLTKMRE